MQLRLRINLAVERWSNLWSRRVRHRVGRFPHVRSVVGGPSHVIPDLISPYGWDVARRSGIIDVSELRRFDPVRRPEDFRRTVQKAWAVTGRADDEHDKRLIECARAVGTPLIEGSGVDGILADVERWQGESFRQWSAALDAHRLVPSWERAGRPTVSVILPTYRPANVDVWFPQIASQTYRPLQVVVGCHGDAWSAGDIERLSSRLVEAGIDSVTLVVDGSATLGEVLSAVSQRADGEVVIKWDDDDLYSTTHVVDLLRIRQYSGATIVGKSSDFVYVESADTTVRRVQAPREIFSPTVSGSTLTMRKEDLRAIGGWAPLKDAEDVDVINRVRMAGGTVYRAAGFGFLVIRKASLTAHTWNPGDQVFLSGVNPRRPGLATDWALVDQPDAVTRRAVSSAPGAPRN